MRTERGGAWLLRTIVPRVNSQIAGHLTVTSLRLQGWRLELRGVTLRTPDGEVVAEAAEVEVTARPLALLRSRLQLERVALEKPVLRLVQDERGLNLQRAVAARIPPKPTVPKDQGGSGPSTLSLSLDALVVRGGLVDFRARLPQDRRHLRVEDIALDGNAAYRAGNGGITAVLRGNARAEAPYPAPIVLDLGAYGEGERGQVRLFLSVGGQRGGARPEGPRLQGHRFEHRLPGGRAEAGASAGAGRGRTGRRGQADADTSGGPAPP